MITKFSNYYDTNGVNATLREALLSSEYQNQVERIREMKDKEDRNIAKAMLPAFFISCVSQNREVGEHTGLVVVEWDKGSTNWIGFIHWLKQFEFILFAGLSVSGRGVFAVIPIAYPGSHHAHFKALQALFISMNVPVDPSGGNVNRLRGISYNNSETSFINLEVNQYTGLVYTQIAKTAIATEKDAAKVQAYVSRIVADGRNVTEGYDNWIRIGLSLASAFSEGGRQWFHDLSALHQNYDYATTDKKYTSFLKDYSSISLGTFYHICDRIPASGTKQ
jgi:hypothetical protein